MGLVQGIERKYGHLPSLEDFSMFQIFGAGKPKGLNIPDEMDMRPNMPWMYDQGSTSSCTGNGGARIIRYGRQIAGYPSVDPSRLFLYFNARKQEGSVASDDGAQIIDIIKGANLYGIIPETDWLFDPNKVTVVPPDSLYEKAKDLKIHNYAPLDNFKIDALRMCLFHGFPIIFGFRVFDYFESQQMADKGILHLPTSSEAEVGGHCEVVGGCDHPNRRFLIANSWGLDWAIKGWHWMDYDYFASQYTSDLWMNRFPKMAA